MHRSLRDTASFLWANAEYEQQWHDKGDVLGAVQKGPYTSMKYAEFLHRLIFHHHRHRRLHVVMVFTPTTYRKCNNFYWHVMPTIYSSADC